ncbi:MAG: EAL domain-containing protein [Nitrospirae bacterium]|nr:EAL domain-containing protein [Candidatus Manganitrophaceae bacterium]
MERRRFQFSRLLGIIRKVIPEGRALPEKEWQARHRAILLLTWLHAVGLTAFGFYRGFGPLQSLGEGALIAAAAMVGSWSKLSRSDRAAAASLGLITSSAILVQLSGGYIEAHFHFFVMLAIISLYQDWVPYLLAILFVGMEHGLTGQFVPSLVYNHPDAFAHPWKWAVIHAVFIGCESVVLLANWRISEQAHARADLVLNSAGETIIGLDPRGIITFANPAAAAMTGYPLDALVGQPIDRVLQNTEDDSPRIDLPRLLQDGKTEQRIDRIVLRRDGTPRRVDSALSPIREHGLIVGAVLTLKDETDRRQAEEALKRTFSLLSATLESTADGILVVDREGKLVRFNQKFIQMWNLPGSFIAPQENEKALAHIVSQLKDPEGFLIDLRKRYAASETEHQGLLELKDGRVFELFSQPQRIGGKTVGRVWSFRDITERKQTEERLQHLANFDPLTHLPNRTLFYERLGQALARARWPLRPVAVLFLDLDHFKTINDTLGHPFGDLLLKLVAERLTGCIREEDTVARLSGDEFVILLEELQARQDILLVAQKIVEALSTPFKLEGRELFITTSMGVAIYPDDGDHCETLLKNADTAMYRAKGQGRNHFQLYAPALDDQATDRLGLENGLRRALERKEFQLHYQPKVDLATRQIIGMESVVRWIRPGAGTLLPAEFIPLAEEIGLIIPLEEWVLRTACVQNRTWQEGGLAPFRIAVHISATHFRRKNLYEAITRLLDETGLSPHALELELKESTLMKGSETTVTTLRQLRAIGIDISIDDFGGGFSSLHHLKQFPVSTLKINRTFIHNITTDPDNRAIVTAIITLAHSLKRKVIAEAVETEEQLQFLRSLQCDQVQGYLLSHPLPAEEITRLLSRQRSNLSRSSESGARQQRTA